MPRNKTAPTRMPESTQEPRWLNDTEMQAWMPLLRVVQLLPQALDRQLREQAGINHVYYGLLSILSAQPERRLQLTELAGLAAMEQSRASHAVSSLEQRGWVERQRCPTDRRVQYIALTDQGVDVLAQTAPGHVAEVRRVVFDHLNRDDLTHLRNIARKLVAVLDQ